MHSTGNIEQALWGWNIADLLCRPKLVRSTLVEIFRGAEKTRLHVVDIGKAMEGKQHAITMIGYMNTGFKGSGYTEKFGIRIMYTERDLAAASRHRADHGKGEADFTDIRSGFIVDLSNRLLAKGFRVNNEFGGGESAHRSFILGQENPKGGTPFGIAVSIEWGGWFHNAGYPESFV